MRKKDLFFSFGVPSQWDTASALKHYFDYPLAAFGYTNKCFFMVKSQI